MLTVIPAEAAERIAALAGKGSPLQRKHCVYIDHVGVANYPENYETRLVRAFPLWTRVRLWALEPHDLALTKLERSNDRDIRDVMYLAQAGLISRATLIERFEQELEPYITGRTPTWNRTTLKMWVDACWPESRQSTGDVGVAGTTPGSTIQASAQIERHLGRHCSYTPCACGVRGGAARMA